MSGSVGTSRSDIFALRGRAIVVTGGAGHLGRAICAGLRDFGAQVLCLSSRDAEFPPSVESIYSTGEIESEICDVADEVAFRRAVTAFAGRHGGLDGLVNNAARAPRGVDFDTPVELFQAAIADVFVHYFTCTRAALPLFREGKGAVVNNSSIW